MTTQWKPSDVSVYARYILIAVVMCGIAHVIGRRLGTARRANAPEGSLPTSIPGVFVDRRVLDLGMIAPDHVAERAFHVFNTTAHPYTVKKVKTDCGCATIDLKNHTLGPKGSLTIPVRINVSSLSASSFMKRILIELQREADPRLYTDVFRFEGRIDRSGTFLAWPGIIHCAETVPNATIRRRI